MLQAISLPCCSVYITYFTKQAFNRDLVLPIMEEEKILSLIMYFFLFLLKYMLQIKCHVRSTNVN